MGRALEEQVDLRIICWKQAWTKRVVQILGCAYKERLSAFVRSICSWLQIFQVLRFMKYNSTAARPVYEVASHLRQDLMSLRLVLDSQCSWGQTGPWIPSTWRTWSSPLRGTIGVYHHVSLHGAGDQLRALWILSRQAFYCLTVPRFLGWWERSLSLQR